MKKHTTRNQLAIKGEAFVDSMLAGHALAHKIDRSKDLGLDFICEWLNRETPTGLLFGIQVKTRSAPTVIAGNPLVSRLNGLDQFKIKFDGDKIDRRTLDYWRGFSFPVFVFLVHMDGGIADCYYKRYTPILHSSAKPEEEYFYKVWKDAQFLALVKRPSYVGTGGFCRDLFFDHLRCEHNKGMLSGIDPAKLGLNGYKEDTLYEGVYNQYEPKIEETFRKYQRFFESRQAEPSAPPPDDDDFDK